MLWLDVPVSVYIVILVIGRKKNIAKEIINVMSIALNKFGSKSQ
jgi:hypothetical protein